VIGGRVVGGGGPRIPDAWRAVFRRGRVLWIGAASGAALLVVGVLIGQYAFPSSATDSTPTAGLVTVPVHYEQLTNVVTVRGQVDFAGPLVVSPDTSAQTGLPVVTGRVPTAGADLSALSIALEIAGRPLIVLPGQLTAYRTLTYGMSGPDVIQFKQAMRTVGIDAGDPADPVFDQTATAAVTTLYAKVGYPPPANADGATDTVADARRARDAAADSVASAQNDLRKAKAGPTAADIEQADNAVRSAQRALDAARAEVPADPYQIGDLTDAVHLASTQRAALNAAPDTRAEELALQSANRSLTDATAALTSATQRALPSLPLGEILYASQLPAHVDKVEAHLGTPVGESVMTLSGTTLGITGSVDPGDAKLLTTTDAATIDMPDGSTHGATITAITPGADADARPVVTLTPDALTPEQITDLAGQNVPVSILVGATKGKVLSVPLAALSAGPGGEARVRVVDGDPRAGTKATTRLVVVSTGLAAAGTVEVTPTHGGLHKNDLVVVTR